MYTVYTDGLYIWILVWHLRGIIITKVYCICSIVRSIIVLLMYVISMIPMLSMGWTYDLGFVIWMILVIEMLKVNELSVTVCYPSLRSLSLSVLSVWMRRVLKTIDILPVYLIGHCLIYG